MNKKLWLIIAVCFLIGLLVSALLNIQKKNISLVIKKGNVDSMSSLVNQVKNLEIKGNLLDAKAIYQRLINEFPNSAEIANWQKKLEEINIRLLFSPTVTAKSRIYLIKPGDTLSKIAKEFKTTVDLIKRSNNLTDDKILPGRKIKVWTDPFSILVDKSQNTLVLKSNEEIIKTYIVSTGANNSTPVGNFRIINKLLEPTWFKAGAVVPAASPENILGSRWMGFDVVGYGIHGTPDPQSLGKQVTQGCVRMSNSDVEELYSIVPIGTELIIVD